MLTFSNIGTNQHNIFDQRKIKAEHEVGFFVVFVSLHIFVLRVLQTAHCSDISHLLPLDTTFTQTFLSHQLFVKVFTELFHLRAGRLRQAEHISQPVNMQPNTNSLVVSPRRQSMYPLFLNIAHTQSLYEKSCSEALSNING